MSAVCMQVIRPAMGVSKKGEATPLPKSNKKEPTIMVDLAGELREGIVLEQFFESGHVFYNLAGYTKSGGLKWTWRGCPASKVAFINDKDRQQ